LVSHELASIRELCTRGLWIQQGHVVADGPVDEILDAYVESVRSAAAVAMPT
jgi:ABC-type polysaccharide/polyol phosphate transport system ATPase subunit